MKAIHVISAVIGGAIAGAAVGLLVAPDKGDETRRKIAALVKEKYSHLLKKADIEKLADEIADEIE